MADRRGGGQLAVGLQSGTKTSLRSATVAVPARPAMTT